MIRDLARLLCACVTLALMASYDAQAQGKKKGKEPELAISKRGKLIFEDDFSGKDLLWEYDSSVFEWKIVKDTLATKSTVKTQPRYQAPSLKRPFSPVMDIVIQLEMFLPRKCNVAVQTVYPMILEYPFAYLRLEGGTAGTSSMCYLRDAATTERVAVSTFPYPKPRWVHVTFEILRTKYALTVDGRTITCDFPRRGEDGLGILVITPTQDQPEMFAIDDVKVWEALPKDEEGEKDKKKKK